MARKKVINFYIDEELSARLDALVTSRLKKGEETNRSKVVRELLKTALRLEEIRQ